MDLQALQMLRSKIGDSFLRSFYSYEYRTLNLGVKNLIGASTQEEVKLRTVASLTSNVQRKLGRVLQMLRQMIDEAEEAAERRAADIKASNDALADTNSSLSDILSTIYDLVRGGYLLRKAYTEIKNRRARTRADAEARARAEAKARAGTNADGTIKTETEVRSPDLEAPKTKPRGRVMGRGVGGLIASLGISAALTYGAGKVTSGVTGEYARQRAAEPPTPPPPPSFEGQEVAALSEMPPPPADLEPAPYSPPNIGSLNTEASNRQASYAAREMMESDTTATVSTGMYAVDEKPPLTTLYTASGAPYQVNQMLAPNFDGFIKALEATGYQIKSIGGYADRNIAGSNKKSFHASGAAIDINPGANPHLFDGSTRTDMPPNISQLAASFGLGWGGDWSSSKDSMHFSAASSEGGSFNIDRNTHEIVPMAAGAKVTKPTLALIGEAGEPEYVVPQRKAMQFAHEMMASTPRNIVKKRTHLVLMPIYT